MKLPAIMTIVAAATLSLPAASDCFNVDFQNKTDQPISISWYQIGDCLPDNKQVKKRRKKPTCQEKALFPGESYTVPFQFGATAPLVYVGLSDSDSNTNAYLKDHWAAAYFYKAGKHKSFFKMTSENELLGTPFSFHKHYEIRYTEDDRKQDLAKAASAADR